MLNRNSTFIHFWRFFPTTWLIEPPRLFDFGHFFLPTHYQNSTLIRDFRVQRKVVLYFDRIFDVLHFSYEYDPDRYEGDEQDKEVVSITKSSEEASTGTVISSTNAKTGDLDKQLSLEVIISILKGVSIFQFGSSKPSGNIAARFFAFRVRDKFGKH